MLNLPRTFTDIKPFFACILIKHINEYGLGHYQALAVKRLFKTQAEHLGLGYDALHQYFILSPLILDAKDYLALKTVKMRYG